jgi:hypothetical protein
MEWEGVERNKVDWLFNESGSISGSRNDAAQFKRNRWVGVVMKSNNWSQRHLVTRRSN